MNTTSLNNSVFQEGMEAFIRSDYQTSLARFSEYLEQIPDDAFVLASRGAAQLVSDNPEAAIADFNASIAIDPDYAKSYHLRGLAYEKTNDLEKALADFDAAVRIDPEYAAAYNSRAAVNNRLGKDDQSAEDLKTLTHLKEKNLQEFAAGANIWRSTQLGLEESGVADVMDR